jgi:RNA polymerase sigma factor (sigma-70 family)
MRENKRALVERLFTEHAGGLSAFFFRRVRNKADASALAQEVYLRFLRVGDTDAIRNPEAYLYSVASNLVTEQRILDARRGISVDIEDPLIQQQIETLDEPSSEIDKQRRSARLQEVLRQLSPKCRAAVVLQYWHGMSYQEIADQLQISTHMVKKYISQGLATCRRRMARLG